MVEMEFEETRTRCDDPGAEASPSSSPSPDDELVTNGDAAEKTSPSSDEALVSNGDDAAIAAAVDPLEGEKHAVAAETDDDDEEEEEEEEEDEDEVEEMVVWSDVDEEEDEVDNPIRSKNELQALPPVPPVVATLEPHHQLLPIGVVLSIVGTQVIVEGMEVHNPLNEGSVLWISELRQPLGLVDEIFGPVKNPYYLVRYNCESDVPAGIEAGAKISFVSEFANHVMNDKNVYKKGYDASGANDEEVSDDGEFSDDEKEAEFRKSLKQSKRPSSGRKSKGVEMKTDTDQDSKWKYNSPSRKQASAEETRQSRQQNQYQRPHEQRQQNRIPTSPSLSRSNGSSSNQSGQDFSGGNGCVPQFPQMVQNPQAFQPLPFGQLPGAQLQQNAALPANNFPWSAMNQLQPASQMSMLNDLAFQQQFNANQFSGSFMPGGQPNFLQRPGFPPPGIMGMNSFNQNAYGLGLQFQAALPPMNPMNLAAANQGMAANQPFAQPNFMQPPAFNPGNNQVPLTFNMGAYPSTGSNPVRGNGWRPPQ